jgi:hypothetical protein
MTRLIFTRLPSVDAYMKGSLDNSTGAAHAVSRGAGPGGKLALGFETAAERGAR